LTVPPGCERSRRCPFYIVSLENCRLGHPGLLKAIRQQASRGPWRKVDILVNPINGRKSLVEVDAYACPTSSPGGGSIEIEEQPVGVRGAVSYSDARGRRTAGIMHEDS
jgi:hypothetical protein